MTARATLARLGVLMAAVFIDMMGALMVLPLLPFYAERMGATPFVVGVLVAAFFFAQVVTAPVWGRLSDRFGRRPVIIGGLIAAALAYLLFGLATSVWVLLLSRLVQGAGGGVVGVIQAYVSDTVPADDRAKALGWLTAATSAGVMVGPALGSLAAGLAPQAPGLIAAALAAVNVAFAWKLLPEPASERRVGARQRLRDALVGVVRDPAAPAHLMIWIYALGMMAFMAMNGVLALYLERAFGITETTIGYFYLYVGGVSLLMRALLLGPAVERFGEIGVLRAGAAALAIGLLLVPVPSSLAGFAVVIALIPIGTAMLFPITASQVSRHAQPGQVGQTLGVQQAVGGVARMAGPIWAGAMFQQIGWSWPFWAAAALVFAALGIALGVVRTSVATPTAAVDSPSVV